MANTLHSLFPYSRNRWSDFTVFPCYTEFSAPVVSGKYIFSEQTTPAVEFGKLLQGQTGIIAGVMISANCSGADFSAAVDKPLKLQILHGGNNTPINMATLHKVGKLRARQRSKRNLLNSLLPANSTNSRT